LLGYLTNNRIGDDQPDHGDRTIRADGRRGCRRPSPLTELIDEVCPVPESEEVEFCVALRSPLVEYKADCSASRDTDPISRDATRRTQIRHQL